MNWMKSPSDDRWDRFTEAAWIVTDHNRVPMGGVNDETNEVSEMGL
jgi:hypothetical protein